MQNNTFDWGGWEQLRLRHAALCQVKTHPETHDLFDLFKCLGFPQMHARAKI